MGGTVPHVRKIKRRPSVTRRARIVAAVSMVAALVLAFGGLYLKQQETLSANAAEAANYSPAPIQPASTAAAKDATIIGDSYTGGSNEGGDTAGPWNWVSVVEDAITSNENPVHLTNQAEGGAGYTSRGQNNSTFGDIAGAAVTPEADLVVFFGSINDIEQPTEQVIADARAAWAKAKAKAPDADLLIVGPPWMSGDVPREITAIRDGLRDAASGADATFVDPLEERWFFDSPELIGADGVHPTDAGHALMAEKLTQRIRAALA